MQIHPIVAREQAPSPQIQVLAEGLRSKLNAIAAKNKTLSNNTAHRPNFFQWVPDAAGAAETAGVTTAPPSTIALPSVASFAAL